MLESDSELIPYGIIQTKFKDSLQVQLSSGVWCTKYTNEFNFLFFAIDVPVVLGPNTPSVQQNEEEAAKYG